MAILPGKQVTVPPTFVHPEDADTNETPAGRTSVTVVLFDRTTAEFEFAAVIM